jgi:hypothetical protein
MCLIKNTKKKSALKKTILKFRSHKFKTEFILLQDKKSNTRK